jgi:hypothetical protein
MIAGGLAALGARISSTSATIICIQPGDPCTDNQLECCPGSFCDGESGLCVSVQLCVPENETCGVAPAGELPSECCKGLVCVNNTCLPDQPPCSEVGESCTNVTGALFCCGDLICVDGTCQVPEPICGEIGDSCGQTEGVEGGCCEGLVCIEGICGDPEPTCAGQDESCDEIDCCEPLVCFSTRGGAVCVEEICSSAGESCSVDQGGQAVCCDDLTCVDGVCTTPDTCAGEGEVCDADADCCTGICCGGACRDIECCIDDPSPNDRCDDGQTCFEGVCEGVTAVCATDDDCDDDTCCCEDGSCSGDCCDEPVTQLPDTGIGASGKGSSTGWLAAAAGAAAAFIAGKTLRPNPEPEPVESAE